MQHQAWFAVIMAVVLIQGSFGQSLKSAETDTVEKKSTPNPKDSSMLREAYNAAISQVIGSGKFMELRQHWKIDEVILCSTCTSGDDGIPFPPKDKVNGRLADVLQKKEITVSGLRYRDLPAGDYFLDVPEGFWPDYMREVVSLISAFYEVDLSINYRYFSSSYDVLRDVELGNSDLSDMYMIISALHNDRNRMDVFSLSCTAAAMESTFFVKASSNVTDLSSLSDYLDQSPNRRIGFISLGDYSVVSPVLPDIEVMIFSTKQEIQMKVMNGEIVAGLFSTKPDKVDGGVIFGSGVVSPRGALMLKDRVCVDAATTAKATIMTVVVLCVALFHFLA